MSRRVDVTPTRMQCVFTAGQVAALSRVGLEQRSTYSLHQQQKPKNSGRDRVNTVKEHIINPRDSAHRYLGELRFFGSFTYSSLCMCTVGDNTSITNSCRIKYKHVNSCIFTLTHKSHLLVVAQLIVQNDAIGLFRLWP